MFDITAVIEAPYLASTSIITGTVIVGGGTTKAILDAGNNYGYDLFGNMVSDVQGGVSNITWTVYGKIKKITKTDGSTLEYKYDADGNRVCKVYTHGTQVDKTWYVRDVVGNVLAFYGNKDGDGNVYWKEQQLYGSSRLGSWYPELNVSGGADGAVALWSSTNKKQYELSNHLENVLARVTDELKGDNTALVMSANDYYPLGMIQPDRSYSSGGYRYGFNGKENDNEVKGDGNQQDYGMRVYDPRVGRFLSVDPLTKSNPMLSPYLFAENSPIKYIDLDGGEKRDPDPYYLKSIPSIKAMQVEALKGLSMLAVAASQNSSLEYAFGYVNTFKNAGRPLSIRNLLRYMEGKGGYDVYSYSSLCSSSNIAFWTANRSVEKNIVAQLKYFVANNVDLNKKGSYEFTAEASRPYAQTGAWASDFGKAFGSFDVSGKGSFMITTDGKGGYTVAGDIKYTFSDNYRWHNGRGDSGDEELVDHSKMNSLQSLGARNFYIKAYYIEGVYGSNGSLNYTDKRDAHATEDRSSYPQGSRYYRMPEGTKQVNNYGGE